MSGKRNGRMKLQLKSSKNKSNRCNESINLITNYFQKPKSSSITISEDTDEKKIEDSFKEPKKSFKSERKVKKEKKSDFEEIRKNYVLNSTIDDLDDFRKSPKPILPKRIIENRYKSKKKLQSKFTLVARGNLKVIGILNLRSRKEYEKYRETLIQNKITNISKKCPSKNCQIEYYDKSYLSNENVFKRAELIENTFENFYVKNLLDKNLISQSTAKPGELLRDWHSIPGREKTPPPNNHEIMEKLQVHNISNRSISPEMFSESEDDIFNKNVVASKQISVEWNLTQSSDEDCQDSYDTKSNSQSSSKNIYPNSDKECEMSAIDRISPTKEISKDIGEKVPSSSSKNINAINIENSDSESEMNLVDRASPLEKISKGSKETISPTSSGNSSSPSKNFTRNNAMDIEDSDSECEINPVERILPSEEISKDNKETVSPSSSGNSSSPSKNFTRNIAMDIEDSDSECEMNPAEKILPSEEIFKDNKEAISPSFSKNFTNNNLDIENSDSECEMNSVDRILLSEEISKDNKKAISPSSSKNFTRNINAIDIEDSDSECEMNPVERGDSSEEISEDNKEAISPSFSKNSPSSSKNFTRNSDSEYEMNPAEQIFPSEEIFKNNKEKVSRRSPENFPSFFKSFTINIQPTDIEENFDGECEMNSLDRISLSDDISEDSNETVSIRLSKNSLKNRETQEKPQDSFENPIETDQIDLIQSSEDEIAEIQQNQTQKSPINTPDRSDVSDDSIELPKYDRDSRDPPPQVQSPNNSQTSETNESSNLSSSQMDCADDLVVVSDDELNYSCSTPYRTIHKTSSVKTLKRKNSRQCSPQTESSGSNCETPKSSKILKSPNVSARSFAQLNEQDFGLDLYYDDIYYNDPHDNRILSPPGMPTTSNNQLNKSHTSSLLSDSFNQDLQSSVWDKIVSTPKNTNPTTPVTPSSVSNMEVIIKTHNVTPMPDYDTMDTPARNRELDKYGLKPLKRKRANELLKYIYEATHPLAKENVAGPSNENDTRKFKRRSKTFHQVPTNTKNKSASEYENVPVVSKFFKHPSTTSHEENCATETSISSNNIEIVGDTLSKNDTENDLIFERRQSTKIPSCRLPFHIAWHNFVSSNPDIRLKILRYEPIFVEDIYAQFKGMGFKFNVNDIIRFLDRRCITIRIKRNNNQNNRRVAKRYQKTKSCPNL